jgi:hypothetical protein
MGQDYLAEEPLFKKMERVSKVLEKKEAMYLEN